MKLAAMEALYEGGTHEPLTVVGSIKIPEMLSFLATHSTAGYVPGINNLLEGGYTLPDGSTALSADEKMVNGKKAITALADFRRAKEEGDEGFHADCTQCPEGIHALFRLRIHSG